MYGTFSPAAREDLRFLEAQMWYTLRRPWAPCIARQAVDPDGERFMSNADRKICAFTGGAENYQSESSDTRPRKATGESFGLGYWPQLALYTRFHTGRNLTLRH